MDQLSDNLIEFTLIYNKHKSALYYYIFKMLNEKMITEDVLQNVFLKFFQNMELIRNKESITSWIYKTARNEIYEHLRKRKSRHEQDFLDLQDLSEFDSDDSVLGRIEKKEMKHLIISELREIPVEQREAYLLKEYAGLSYREISNILEIDEELVKSRLFKARKKLIEKISKLI